MTARQNIVIAVYSTLFIAALAVLAPAFANGIDRMPSIAVRYDDLNISRRAGAKVLVGRLWRAAQQVCGEEHFLADLRGQAGYKICERDSMARAVAAVGEPLVSDIYQQQTGRTINLAGN